MTAGAGVSRCSCKDLELKEGQEERCVKGLIHTRMRCKPVMTAEDAEDAGVAVERRAKKPRREKKRKKKKFKWSVSNGLRNVLVIARHGAAFDEELAKYTNRKQELDLFKWAAGHSCGDLKKLHGMGSKKLQELLKRLDRADLKLTCGCPCAGVPQQRLARPRAVPAVWCPKCEVVIVGTPEKCATCETGTVPLYRPTLTSEVAP